MKLSQIVTELNLTVLSGSDLLDKEVTGGYVSDLLSDALANTKEGHIWITLQIHPNVISVASINRIAGIIIVSGRKPDEYSLKKADEENVVILSTQERSFQIVCKLFEAGVGKVHEYI